jgi:hypothetical protein
MIIHIAGTSGSGKSYIGNLYTKKINVVELDDWTEEYEKEESKKSVRSFVKFITAKLHKLDPKSVHLLVGYLDLHIAGKVVVYPLATKYKFFIKMSADALFIQYNLRLLNIIIRDKALISKKIKAGELLYQFKTIDEIKSMYKRDAELYVTKNKYLELSHSQITQVIDKIAK